MKILVVGSSSFAAQGLTGLLQSRGHEVWSLNRRPERALCDSGLAGNLATITDHATQLQQCDVVVNYLLMKDSSLEQNLRFFETLNELLKQIKCRRLIHISSISVLAPVNGTVTEKEEPPDDFRQKGGYSQLKIATERWVTSNVTHCQLVIARPGFVVAPGLLDPIVGMGKLLPTQRILGLGHRRSIIPTIDRSLLNEGIARLCAVQLKNQRTTVMFADPISPGREEYLEYCCTRYGLGRGTMFLPPWIWNLSLAAASLPISLMKRQWINLPARFSHNLKVRRYDPRATEQLLGLDLRGDWKTLFAEALEFQKLNFRLPTPFIPGSTSHARNADTGICYLGMGRIAIERHIPALRKLQYDGLIEWYDPFVKGSPSQEALKLKRTEDPQTLHGSKAIITTPVSARLGLLSQLPETVNEVLFEKPFAISPSQFSELDSALGQRPAYVIHNYRFKPHVQWAWRYLSRHNPGELQETRLHFDSPAVDLDKASWMRDERQARTLLIDYAIHFLDLAWLFAEGQAQINELDVRRNLKGQTMSVGATVKFANHVSRLLVRQGARQRRCQIEFVFSNYTLVLRFFPDSAAAIHGQYTFADDFRLGFRGLTSIGRKVAEKFGMVSCEPSHEHILGAFLGRYQHENLSALSLEALRPFYSRLLALAELVYSEPGISSPLNEPRKIRPLEPASVMDGSV